MTLALMLSAMMLSNPECVVREPEAAERDAHANDVEDEEEDIFATV